MGINYGLEKVRFITPVPAGSRIRASARIIDAAVLPDAVQARLASTIELEGAEKPAAVVESVVRYIGS